MRRERSDDAARGPGARTARGLSRAGAVVLETSEETGILSTHIHADGQYEELLHVPCGISNGLERVMAGEINAITCGQHSVIR